MRNTIIFLTLTIIFSIFCLPVFSEIGIGLGDIIDKKMQQIKPELKTEKIITNQPELRKVNAVNKVKEKEVIISPNNPALEGDTVVVTVKSPKMLQNPFMTFKGKKIRLFKKGEGVYKGYIGLDAWHKTGKYAINLKDATGYLNDTKELRVAVKKYPNQYITLSGKKSGLTATAEELRNIQYAKTAFSEKSFWDKVPFDSPTEGCISSVYGLNRYYNGVMGGYHKGVDIAAPQGQIVKAVTDGVVTVSNMYRLHGGTVGINHGQGLTSLYLHLHKLYVKSGQVVKAGEPIAEVGSTGISTGPHLHWGLYVNGVSVDPYGFWVKSCKNCE